MNNLSSFTDPSLSFSPESPSPAFVGSLEELLSSLNGDWSPPGGDARQVSIVDDCRSSVAFICPDEALVTFDPDGLLESVLLREEAQNICGAGQISPTTSAADFGTVKILPSDEEKLLVKQMLADALACQGQLLLPPCPDKKMADTPVASRPDNVSTGNHPMDMPMALPVNPIQVTGHTPHREEVANTQNSSPLATLSTWLNSVSKPRLAVKPKRLDKHSVRSHPYAQAKIGGVCHSKTSDTSAPVELAPVAADTDPAREQSRVSPAQYVSVICRVDN